MTTSHPREWLKSKEKLLILNVGMNVGQGTGTHTLPAQPFWKIICPFLINLNIYLYYDPEIALLTIYPR